MKDSEKIVDLKPKNEPIFLVTNDDLLLLVETISKIQNDMSKINHWVTERIESAGMKIPVTSERTWRED